MNRKIKIIANSLLAFIITLLLVTCALHPQSMRSGQTDRGTNTFHSNGERIYLTSTSDRGTNITYTGGQLSGGMMGGSKLTCASCHNLNGRGGVHTMMGMPAMTAKDIRWSVLKSEFDAEKFRLAVTKGQDPDGTQLNNYMPRWNIGNEDLTDLIAYLKTLS